VFGTRIAGANEGRKREHTGGLGGYPPMNPRTGIYLFRMLTESWLMVVNLLVIH